MLQLLIRQDDLLFDDHVRNLFVNIIHKVLTSANKNISDNMYESAQLTKLHELNLSILYFYGHWLTNNIM